MPIDSALQQVLVDYLKGIGVSQRKFADATGVSETTFGTYSRMTSAMGVDLLDKILTTYPGARTELIRYLGGNTEENHTGDNKSLRKAEIMDKINTVYRDLVEANTEYRLVPKKILDDYDMLPKKELENRNKMMEIVTQAMDEAKDALIEKYEIVIAGLKQRIERLEKENEDLRGGQIPG